MITYSVLCVGGTFETQPTDTVMTPVRGMLAEVTRHLDRNRFRPRWVPYSAKYGNGMSYDASLRNGRERLLDGISNDWNPAIVIGFSQGAQVAGDVARDIAAGMFPDLDVRGVGLIADPSRGERQDTAVGVPTAFGNSLSYGIAGRRHIPTTKFPVWTLAAPGDPICALPPGNPLRSIADLTRYASSNDPLSWARSAMEGAKRAQPWWDLGNWSSWGGAINALRGYLPYEHLANPGGGRHVCYGSERVPGLTVPYTQRLAQLISELPR